MAFDTAEEDLRLDPRGPISSASRLQCIDMVFSNFNTQREIVAKIYVGDLGSSKLELDDMSKGQGGTTVQGRLAHCNIQ